MHVIVRQPDLLHAVAAVARIAKSETIPIVGCVRLQAKAGHGFLEVAGTDLDLSLRFNVEAKVEQAGTAVITAKLLSDVLKGLRDGDVELETRPDGWTRVAGAGDTHYRLAGLPAEDFPALPDPKGDGVDLPAAPLARLISRVRMAIIAEDARYYISGALQTLGPAGLELAATDGHRMSVTRHPLEAPPAEPTQALIARAAVEELPTFLADCESVSFRATPELLSWTAKRDGLKRFMTVKAVEGTFPQYQRVFDAARAGTAWSASVAGLTAALNRVRIIRTGKGHTAVQFGFSKGAGLELKTESPDIGTATDRVALEGWDAAAITVGLNAAYVLDWLAVAKGEGVETVRGHATSPEAAVLFEPVADGIDWSYVVMPLRF